MITGINYYSIDVLPNYYKTSNKMRCMDIIRHEKQLYNVYVTIILPYNPHRKLPKYGTTYQIYEYILRRKQLYHNGYLYTDTLKCYNLTPINQINIQSCLITKPFE